MSHSTVLVIGEDPETMLAPFDEGIDVEPYRKDVDIETPQKHWAFDKLVEVEGLAADAGWPAFLEALAKRYEDDDDERLQYDPETDRVYEMSTYNPQSRWDWYILGGRWTGFFMLREGRVGATGEPGVMTPAAKDDKVDQARKGDIDFDAMRNLAEAEAYSFHAQCRTVLDGLPIPTAWPHVREVMFPGDIDAARQHYHAQPALQALRQAGMHIDDPATYLCLTADDPAAAYAARERAAAGLPFAVLNADGWHERGRMGWWGVVRDETDDWPTTAQALIDAAPDDALFSLYDVHI